MNILITGASRGVGLAICEVLLRQGHIVYAISRSYTDELKILKQRFNENFFFKSVDLSKPQDVKEEIFKTFVSNSIILDGFINNAAMAYDDIITNLSLDKLEEMYKTNVFSPMMITKNVIRNMLFNRKSGSIIHISSISAHTGYKGLAMYASSKGAIEAFSKNTAREWGEMGIRSNVVVPGFMETAMSASLSTQQKDRIYKRTSLKKATSIESVAETVVYLLSDKACSITGQNIHVDAGTI